MPKRRLPRSDDERSAALSTCAAKAQSTPPAQWLITGAQNSTLSGTLSQWRGVRDALGPALHAQTAATATVETVLAVSARYNSHFIQVLNLAIERGNLPASVRSYYQLPLTHTEMPMMNTCPLALLWAGHLVTGETARVAAGGTAMAWPTITQVNAAATACASAENIQSGAKTNYDLAQESISDLRQNVDAMIKDLWDTIEFNLRTDTSSSLRRKAREWGVVYDGDEEAPAPPTPPVPPTPPPAP